MEGKIYGRWWYQMSLDLFWYPGYDQPIAFENKGYINWKKSDSIQFTLGYWFSRAEYPFGWQSHMIVPVIDIAFAWD